MTSLEIINLERHVNELYRRFRWALVGYVVLSVCVIAGLAVGFVHEAEITHEQQALKRTTYQVAVLLATAEYHLCTTSDMTRQHLKLDNLIDCKADRQSAADIYQRLTK